uniref:hypothetical protein n=1 Tax=Aliarcobacter sp. TaxID=2321116 RepID=UPI004047CCA3
MAKKNIVVGGFTKEQRIAQLDKIKTKYEKKGYKFLQYLDNGTLKSVAVFEVSDVIIKKERSAQLIVVGVGFLVISAILYFKSMNIN